jgi:hypothetical protein
MKVIITLSISNPFLDSLGRNENIGDFRVPSETTGYNMNQNIYYAMHTQPTYPDFQDGHADQAGDRAVTIDDSYNQAGPPSFSKSGYPVQMKKGGSYE